MAGKQVAPKDRWSIMVDVYLPRADPKNSKIQFVRINDRTFSVPKGKISKVPLPVYELLMRSQKQNDATYKFIQDNTNNTEM